MDLLQESQQEQMLHQGRNLGKKYLSHKTLTILVKLLLSIMTQG